MQDRYAGDIGDFGKFYMLRCLADKSDIGINWYNSGCLDFEKEKDGRFKQNDGKYRNFTNVKKINDTAMNLAEKLELIKENPSISGLESLDLIENAVYYNATVPRDNSKRNDWHKGALAKLEKCELIFLDPDNGLLCRSVKEGTAKSVKYTYYSEVKDYLMQKNVKAVIIYNHRCRKKEQEYFCDIVERLCKESCAERDLIQVISFCKYSVRDYFVISRDINIHNDIKLMLNEMTLEKYSFCSIPNLQRWL